MADVGDVGSGVEGWYDVLGFADHDVHGAAFAGDLTFGNDDRHSEFIAIFFPSIGWDGQGYHAEFVFESHEDHFAKWTLPPQNFAGYNDVLFIGFVIELSAVQDLTLRQRSRAWLTLRAPLSKGSTFRIRMSCGRVR